MATTTPDHIVATLNLRARQTVVDIAYDTKGLLHGETDHTSGQAQNYNGWIENLDNAIRTQFIAVNP